MNGPRWSARGPDSHVKVPGSERVSGGGLRVQDPMYGSRVPGPESQVLGLTFPVYLCKIAVSFLLENAEAATRCVL